MLRESREKAGLSSLKFPEPPKTSSLLSFTSTNNKNFGAGSTNLNNKLNENTFKSKNNFLNNKFSSTNNISKKNIKLCRQVYSLEEILNDPLKTRLYIDKLNIQIKEKVIFFSSSYIIFLIIFIEIYFFHIYK